LRIEFFFFSSLSPLRFDDDDNSNKIVNIY
jgi:hypothetical protein